MTNRVQTSFIIACSAATVWIAVSLPATAEETENKPAVQESTKDGSNKTEDKKDGEKKERRKDVRMPFFTGGILGGMVFYGDYDVSATDENNVTQKLKVSERAGVILKLHFNLLGDGLGIEINPLFSSEWTGDTEVEKFTALGAQLGIAYRFHIRRFYPKIGIGGHVAYLKGDNVDAGLEAYGRLPIGFSIYFVRFMAIDFEVAWMSGVTGIRTAGLGVFDDHIRYDYTSGLEAVIGIRFP
jgi:hypothetical protein